MTYYVIGTTFVEHEGTEQSCKEYVRNVGSLFDKHDFRIVKGAKAREMALRAGRNWYPDGDRFK